MAGPADSAETGVRRLATSVPLTFRLVLLRHGESEWNARNLFTGWVDVGLSAVGEGEAARAGYLLDRPDLRPAVVHTSMQRRAIQTADLALAACDRSWVPVRRSWRLNSNHYGALQGQDKDQVRAEYGERQVLAWRRQYDCAPPPMPEDAPYSQWNDPRYAVIPPDARPRAESLADVTARLLPYWYDAIVPDLLTCRSVLVVSHGNTLRALIKHLDGVSAEQSASLEVPTGLPVEYRLSRDMRPVVPGGRRLSSGAELDGLDDQQQRGDDQVAAQGDDADLERG
jgi:2,3-bisphosphoglycerate-dependent phosphoglycerate mutase